MISPDYYVCILGFLWRPGPMWSGYEKLKSLFLGFRTKIKNSMSNTLSQQWEVKKWLVRLEFKFHLTFPLTAKPEAVNWMPIPVS